MRAFALVAMLLATSVATAAAPQSQQVSDASTASMAAVSQVPKASLEVLAAGGHLTVVAVRSSARGVSVVVRSSATGLSTIIETSTETAGRASLVAGSVILVSVVAAGYILSGEDGHPFAFVPNERVLQHIHSREIS